MNNNYENNILYIHAISNDGTLPNVLNHFSPIKQINNTVYIRSINFMTMSKHISRDSVDTSPIYKNIVVVIPEIYQSFENLIYYNFEDYDYIKSIIDDDIFEIDLKKLENKTRYCDAYENSKKKFEKFKCKSNSDICRIQKKINEILEYDELPLDVYYINEKQLKTTIDCNNCLKFKPKINVIHHEYKINSNNVLVTPFIHIGYGDFSKRFGNLYCVIKNMGFKIIRNDKHSYKNQDHVKNDESLFTFKDSPFYQHFESDNSDFDIVTIAATTLNLFLFYDINYTKSIIGNRLGIIHLDIHNPIFSNELATLYSDIKYTNQNRYIATSRPEKSYFDTLNIETLIVLHIRLDDCEMRGKKFTYYNLMKILSEKFKNQTINLVILSDGLKNVKSLETMDKDTRKNYFYLYDLKPGNTIEYEKCKVNIHDIVIGSNMKNDYLCIKYIYHSKYMIRPNSSFPIVLSETLGKIEPGNEKNNDYFISVG